MMMGSGGKPNNKGFPTIKETTFTVERFRCLLLFRLQLPLPLAAAKCRCGQWLDTRGRHRAACSTVGILAKRGAPLEVAAARVCSEAGARVSKNVFVRDMNVTVSPTDTRKIEVVANGLPLYGGAQLAVDTTLVSPVRGDGRPRAGAQWRPAVAIRDAERSKTVRYHELTGENRCRLVVLAFEVGGRWSASAAVFVHNLAKVKAMSCPSLLRRSAEHLFFNRWTALLSCAAQSAFAASLLEEPLGGEACVNGNEPHLAEMECHPVLRGTSSAT